jgi:hypothetical protein
MLAQTGRLTAPFRVRLCSWVWGGSVNALLGHEGGRTGAGARPYEEAM